ncbi:MAG: DUF1893 domain-containing protein [Bacillota bacterium]|nr:DUF1893 domain-containing protein [Bacillota bacterium]
MKDIDLARQLLETGGHSIVAVKAGMVIGTASGPGVGPLLKLVEECRSELMGAAVADKVVGRAVALVCAELGVAAVYGAVMSETAVEVFARYGIEFSSGMTVPTIMNRTQTDLCPIERGSQGLPSAHGATDALKQILAQLRANAPKQ